MAAGSSSSCAINYMAKHDVFLSFRGEDTRRGFTSHLYDALDRINIQTYIDYKLERGDGIAPALLEAISESQLSIIIFSKNYASSRWCLDELVHILKSRASQFVIPIFYDVDPSDVRKQSGSYGDAFVEHEKHFEVSKLNAWREALTTAGNISGFDSNSTEISTEVELVKLVVNDVLEKLNRKSQIESGLKGLVGIEKHVQEVESLLCLESNDVRTVGIWGMGGIGKSTIADVIYKRFSSRFKDFCFIQNVGERSKTREELYKVRDQLLSTLLKQENLRETAPSIGSMTKKRLSHTKALVVLDDVNGLHQLEFLTGYDHTLFGLGSRVVVTTRDKSVLHMGAMIYEVKELDCDEALDLFHLRALRNLSPTTEYETLSRDVVDYARGNPLALTVLGALFCHCRSKEDWKSELEKLKRFPNKEIHYVLKLSYDALGKNEKGIFLDIACFHKGKYIDVVERILESCGFSANAGVRLIIDMSLISVDKDSRRLQMHDLIQEMGRKVVSDVNNPENGSRLWLANEQVGPALEKNKGTKAIEGIVMNIDDLSSDLHVNAASFEKMDNLRLLDIHSVLSYLNGGVNKMHLPPDFDFLPDTLTYLRWLFYPLPSLPSRFCLKNLVELRMCNSRLERLWNKNVQIDLRSVKHIELSRSKKLVELPDLSKSTNLESINLRGCSSLVQLPSFQSHAKLTHLNLENCSSLTILPDLSKSPNLESIDLRGCSSLVQLPSFHHDAKLTHLNLENLSSLTILPDLSKSPNLESINLRGCSSLVQFPSFQSLVQFPSFQSHAKLTRLNLENCSSLTILPDLPKSPNLESINLRGCSSLVQFPSFQSHVKLTRLNLENCSSLTILPDLSKSPNLESINLRGCSSLVQLPSFQSHAKLTHLNLENCSSLQILPQMPGNLEVLSLEGTAVELPSSIWSLEKLTKINITMDGRFTRDSCRLNLLRSLDRNGCYTFESLSVELPVGLKKLDLTHCLHLISLPVKLPSGLEELKLTTSYCYDISSSPMELPAGLSRMCLTNSDERSLLVNLPVELKNLNLTYRSNLRSLEIVLPGGIEELHLNYSDDLGYFPVELPDELKTFHINDCNNLGCFPVELPAGLKQLTLSNCGNLDSCPFKLPTGLKLLNLSDCENLDSCPFELPVGLEELRLTCCVNLRSLSIALPAGLESLYVLNCENLGSLPDELPDGLKQLKLFKCKNLLSLPDELPDGLKQLKLFKCKNLLSLPIALPAGLECLDVENCENLGSLPDELPDGLKQLKLFKCKNLLSLPDELPDGLKQLKLFKCKNLLSLPIALPAGLECLDVENCENLGSLLDELPDGLKQLRLFGCKNLLSLPDELPDSLKQLKLFNCKNLLSLPDELPDGLKQPKLFNCKNAFFAYRITSWTGMSRKTYGLSFFELKTTDSESSVDTITRPSANQVSATLMNTSNLLLYCCCFFYSAMNYMVKHDVFLSFRGEDTRVGFTSHLCDALGRNKIQTYIDYKLERGDEIAPALLEAINESHLSIILFSKNYASSRWCLEELVHILFSVRPNLLQVTVGDGSADRDCYRVKYPDVDIPLDTTNEVIVSEDSVRRTLSYSAFDPANLNKKGHSKARDGVVPSYALRCLSQ